MRKEKMLNELEKTKKQKRKALEPLVTIIANWWLHKVRPDDSSNYRREESQTSTRRFMWNASSAYGLVSSSPQKPIKFYAFYSDEIIMITMMKGLFLLPFLPTPTQAMVAIFLICKFTQVFPLNFFSLCFHFSPLISFFIVPGEKKSFRVCLHNFFTSFRLLFAKL